MSPSVMTLPARNFKFLTEESPERRGNYRLCEKEETVEICRGLSRFAFPGTPEAAF
jgi:hypothetical protein